VLVVERLISEANAWPSPLIRLFADTFCTSKMLSLELYLQNSAAMSQ
jgi:hypothetical protein